MLHFGIFLVAVTFFATFLYFSASLLVWFFLLAKEGCLWVVWFGFVFGRFFDSRRESFLGFRVLTKKNSVFFFRSQYQIGGGMLYLR